MFTIDRLTQKDTAPTVASMHRASSSAFQQPHQSHVESIMPNFGFLHHHQQASNQSPPRSSPPEKDAINDKSPTNSVSSSPPRTPDSQGVGSPIVADKHKKPDYSYIALIAMAILNAPEKRLLLCDIYSYIQTNYPFYRNNDRSWRNSIRHNLSLNECFIKCGRSGDGRGNFWGIHPANIEDFARGDYRRRRARRRVRAAHDLTQSYLYHPYSSAIHAAAAAAVTSYNGAPVGFVPMSCTTFPPYSMVPPGPFYPPPVSIPYTIPHILQKPSYNPITSSTIAAPSVSTTNSISAPIISSTQELRRSSPTNHLSTLPVSPPSSTAHPVSAFSSSYELTKTLRASSSPEVPSPSTSSMYTMPFPHSLPTTHVYTQQQFNAWDRAALQLHHQMYNA